MDCADGGAMTCAKVGVLGSGAWGLALARLFSTQGHCVTVWSESAETVARLDKTHVIPLPGDPKLPEDISLTTSVEEACADNSSGFKRRVFVKKALLEEEDPYCFTNWNSKPHLIIGDICVIGSKILSSRIQAL